MDKYLEFKEGIEAAESDTTPFIIPDEEIAVVGDANKTQLNTHDFEITFRIPVKMEDGSVKQVKKTKEYKDVYITPRMDSQVVKLLTKFFTYFRKPLEDGNISDYTDEELNEIRSKYDTEMIDLMYETVGVVLKIDPVLRECMLQDSVEQAALKIIAQYPEVVNEADTFFDSSSEARQSKK